MKFLIVFSALLAVSYAGLARIAEPALGAINPLAQGLGHGLQQGAGNVKAAVENVGAGLQQGANAAADIAAYTAAGLGSTVGRTPQALLGVLHNLQHGGGPLGDLFNTIFGS